MSLERVSLAADSIRDQQLQDAISRVTREIANELVLSYGKPTPIIYSDYAPKLGDMVRVDPSGGTLTIKLPSFDRGDEGKSITIVNVGTSTNTVTIAAADGLVNGASSQTVSKGKFIRQATAVNASTREWILTTVTDGNTSATESPIWEWNGADTTQFGTLVNGDNVTTSSLSVVSANGRSWLRFQVTPTTASVGHLRRCSVAPIAYTPSTPDYKLTCDIGFGSSLIAITNKNFGAVLRWASGTGVGTGYQALYDYVSATGFRVGYVLNGAESGTQQVYGNYPAQAYDGDVRDYLPDSSFSVRDDALVSMSMGSSACSWADAAGSITAANVPALLVGSGGALANTMDVLFTNLKLWAVT